MYKSAKSLTVFSILVILTSNSVAAAPVTFSNVFTDGATVDMVVESTTCSGKDCLDFKFIISNYNYNECLQSPNDHCFGINVFFSNSMVVYGFVNYYHGISCEFMKADQTARCLDGYVRNTDWTMWEAMVNYRLYSW
jgi:hypothetical protein